MGGGEELMRECNYSCNRFIPLLNMEIGGRFRLRREPTFKRGRGLLRMQSKSLLLSLAFCRQQFVVVRTTLIVILSEHGLKENRNVGTTLIVILSEHGLKDN